MKTIEYANKLYLTQYGLIEIEKIIKELQRIQTFMKPYEINKLILYKR